MPGRLLMVVQLEPVVLIFQAENAEDSLAILLPVSDAWNMSNLPPGCPSDDGMTPDQRDWEILLERIGDTPIDAEQAARRWDSQPALLSALVVSHGQWIQSVNAQQCLAAIAKAENTTDP